jgi:alpha-tubulin suppressor-like RCC1 family protein
LGVGNPLSYFYKPTTKVQGITGLANGVYISYGFNPCIINTSNVLYCWGGSSNSILGSSIYDDQNEAIEVFASYSFVSISTSISHACAMNSFGKVYCWGDNYNGQLGDKTTEYKEEPTLIN